MYEPLFCQDCGGKGIDPGSLNEPEACVTCQGSGWELVETSPSCSNYGERKPMGRAGLPYRPTLAELDGGRYGD